MINTATVNQILTEALPPDFNFSLRTDVSTHSKQAHWIKHISGMCMQYVYEHTCVLGKIPFKKLNFTIFQGPKLTNLNTITWLICT